MKIFLLYKLVPAGGKRTCYSRGVLAYLLAQPMSSSVGLRTLNWCPRDELNTGPPGFNRMLYQLSYVGIVNLVVATGFEPVSTDYRSAALTN